MYSVLVVKLHVIVNHIKNWEVAQQSFYGKFFVTGKKKLT
jgi:hypothetical protein